MKNQNTRMRFIVSNQLSKSSLVEIMVRVRADRARALAALWARLTGTAVTRNV